jgi:hypothetical protein
MPERIRWLRDEGIVYQGMWEPVYFQVLRGGVNDAVFKANEFRHTREYVEYLASEGINQLWTHFFKGFGIRFEHDEMERNRELARICREKGIRVIAYCTFGTIVPDTILLEEPDALSWAQVNEDGRYTSCQTAHQNFRVRPCYNSRGWRNYMKRVVEKALEMGLDGIHFDNIGYNAEPDSCKCPTCQRLFRDFLASRYSGSPEKEALALERFGYTDFTHASLPWFNRWNQAINMRVISGPLHQEWLWFKVESLTGALVEIAEHIRSVNPNALVEANAGKAIGVNVLHWHGISPEHLYHHLDLLFNESGGFKVNEKGALVSRCREMKIGRASGVPVIMYCRSEAELAESLAFNQGCFAGGGGRDVNQYFHRVKKYAARTESLAEVAVLYHAPTLAYSLNAPYESFITLTQVLIENHIPFDVVYGSHLADLSRYRLLVLPDVECLSDEEAGLIRCFVEQGGALLATEQTGVFDNWRRTRVHKEITPRSMDDFKKMQSPLNALAALFGTDNPNAPVFREAGKGRVAYLPKIDYVERMGTTPEVWMYDTRYWSAPANEDEVLRAVEKLLPNPRFIVKGEGNFLFEPLRVLDTGEVALHVAVLDPMIVNDVKIDMAAAAAPAKAVRIDRMKGERPADAKFKDGRLKIRLDELTYHGVVVLSGPSLLAPPSPQGA